MINFWLIARVLIFQGFTFILALMLFCDWFERKIDARSQNTVGPIIAGPAGILQPIADFIKLPTKEDWKILLPAAILFLMLTVVLVNWMYPLV
jgi:NADH:ubiquinone oxidoreductase subunit H